MLDIRFVRENPELVKENIRKKFQDAKLPLVDEVIALDAEYRAAIGARPGRAILLRDEKGLLSGGITEESSAAFADYAAEVVPTEGNLRGSGAYRTHLTRVLTRRGLTELGGMG